MHTVPAASSSPSGEYVAEHGALERFQSGDRQIFSRIVEHYSSRFRRYFATQCTAQDPDDCLQEFWLLVLRGCGSFDPTRPLEPWLQTIAMHCAASICRRRSVIADARSLCDQDLSYYTDARTPPPDSHLLHEEEYGALQQAIAALSPSQRQSAEHFLAGESVPGNAMERVRKQLRILLLRGSDVRR